MIHPGNVYNALKTGVISIPLPDFSGHATSQVVSCGGIKGALTAATTAYIAPGYATENTTENYFLVIPKAGFLRGLYAHAGTAPGGATTVVMTVRKGAAGGAMADTTITCTLTGAAVDVNDVAHSVAVAAGDRVCVKSVTLAAAAAADLVLSLIYEISPAVSGDLAAQAQFRVPKDIEIIEAGIIAQGTASGIDASNTSAWSLKNGSTVIATKTYTNTVVFPTANAYSALTLTAANANWAEGDILTLTVVNGATVVTCPVMLQIEYIYRDTAMMDA